MVRRLVWLLLLFVLVAAGAVLLGRGTGFSARRGTWPFEESIMRGARRWATPPAIVRQVNPVAASADNLRAGREHWADHCATCHSNDGSGDTKLGRNLYPPAPDMRGGRTQQMSDGELFYVIERGIPFTGMPAWGTGTSDGEQDSWRLVQFIRHLPNVTEEELTGMEPLNPKSPADVARKHDIDEFLSGK